MKPNQFLRKQTRLLFEEDVAAGDLEEEITRIGRQSFAKFLGQKIISLEND
jgi:hypothetical protein